jgi:hypothetical protein
VDEVVTATAAAVDPDDLVRLSVAVPADERRAWDQALQCPLQGTRLVVIRDAGKMRHWGALVQWIAARELGSVWLLLVAAEDDFPRDDDGKLAVPATLVRDSALGRLVHCSMPNEEDLTAWAVRQLPPGAGKLIARYLLTRAGGDLGLVKAAAAKAHLFSGVLTESAVDVLCAERPGEEFAVELLAGRKREAMLSAAELSEGELLRSVGLLASRLDTLSVLHAAGSMERREMASKLGIKPFLIALLAPLAPDYGPERVRRCREALVVADDASRSGARDGVAEALTALWA